MKHYREDNEGNDGSIWGSKVRLVVAIVIISLTALASFAPALAISGFGK